MIASGAKWVLIDDLPWYVVIVPIVFVVFFVVVAILGFFGRRDTGTEPKA